MPKHFCEKHKNSQNRLWIGTNDAGIARYENGAFAYFTKEDGLISDSVRCFAEDGEGNIYVGTSDKICVFRADDRIEVLDYDISFVKEMAVYKDLLIAIDNNGKLYLITERKIYSLEDEIAKQCFCLCIAVSSKGLLAGTDEGEVLMLDVSENGIKLNKVMNLTADSASSSVSMLLIMYSLPSIASVKFKLITRFKFLVSRH